MTIQTAKFPPPETEKELVRAWLRRARESQLCHYEMAHRMSRYDKYFGVPVIVISVIVGGGTFYSVSEQLIPVGIKILFGFMAVIITVLASLQTFFRFSERSEKHNNAAVRYGCLRRKLEHIYVQTDSQNGRKLLETLRSEIDLLAEESPHVPDAVYRKIQKQPLFTGELVAVGPATDLESAPLVSVKEARTAESR